MPTPPVPHRTLNWRASLRALAVAALLFLPVTAPAQYDVIGVYLTWHRDPATTMTVNWVNLYAGEPGHMWYRKLGEKEWAQKAGDLRTAGPSILQVRRVEVTGLEPDTMYEFMLGQRTPPPPKPPTDAKAKEAAKAPDDAKKKRAPKTEAEKKEEARKAAEKEEEEFYKPAKPPVLKDTRSTYRFRTMPAELTRPVRFVTGGDMMHSREMVDDMNKRAGALDPDFAVLGGDLAYANGVDAARWIDWFQSWTRHAKGKGGRLIPMIVAIGNHEVNGGYKGRIPEDAPYFYSFFSLPGNRSYNVLDFGEYLTFIALDTGHTQPIAGAQTEWLKEVLSERAGQRFLFPFYHWPAYGTEKAPKGKLPAESRRSIEIQRHWIPHFERHGVTAVFENDHHNFKRSHPIRANKRDDANGIVYLGDGAWGVQTRTVPKNAWYLAKAEPRRHLFHVTLPVTGPVRVEAMDAKGVVFDRTSFTRPRTPPAVGGQ